MSSAQSYQVGGSLQGDSAVYVERAADAELFTRLLAGDTCCVFNSRQMGKSSLRVRTMQRLRQEGVVYAVIDPQLIGSPPREEQWYAGAIKQVIEDLGLAEAVPFSSWWRDDAVQALTPVNRFAELIDKILLPRITARIVIFVEEVDSLLSLKFVMDDFFGLIRSLNERRAEHPAYQRLTFCFLGVATPYDLIRSQHGSAFNVGHAVEMAGFTLPEATPLLAGLQGRVAEPEAALAAVLHWSGGQPFLTQKLLALLLQQPQGDGETTAAWVERVVQEGVISNWEAQDHPPHLRTIRDRLLAGGERGRGRLLGLTQQVLSQPAGVSMDDTPAHRQLRLTGLVTLREGRLQLTNPVYGAVFNADWLQRELAAMRPPSYAEALTRWQAEPAESRASALLRDTALLKALGWAKGKLLSEADQTFLDASQAAELERLSRIGRARAVAFAARERAESEPDLALLLAAESVALADVPEARAALLGLLQQQAFAVGVLHSHELGRRISGLAFSPDGRWLASIDRSAAFGDERVSRLTIHASATGSLCWQIRSDAALSALAWGERWLAVASAGSIGWIRWDHFKEKFRTNTPSALAGGVMPDHLAFSSGGDGFPFGEMLAWGSRSGDVGLIRVGDHASWQGSLASGDDPCVLQGLAWLRNGMLLSAENDRLRARHHERLDQVHELFAPGQIFSLSSRGDDWVVACVHNGSLGLLRGRAMAVQGFTPIRSHAPRGVVAWAGTEESPWLLFGSGLSRGGEPAVHLWDWDEQRRSLLAGDEQLISAVAADRSSRYLAAGEQNGRVWLWDTASDGHLLKRFKLDDRICCLSTASAAGTAIATDTGRLVIAEGNRFQQPQLSMDLPLRPSRLLFGDSGRFLIAADASQRLILGPDRQPLPWSSQLGQPLQIVMASEAPRLAALFPDQLIHVFEITPEALIPLGRIRSESPIIALQLDPSGRRLVAALGRLGAELFCWNLDAIDQSPEPITALFAGDLSVPMVFQGRQQILVGDGDDLQFIDLSGPPTVMTRRGHDNPIRFVASGCGHLATAACSFTQNDRDQIQLWSADGQRLILIDLPEHVEDLAISADPPLLLALGQSGALWSVPLNPSVWIDAAHRIAGQPLSEADRRAYGIDPWRDGATEEDQDEPLSGC